MAVENETMSSKPIPTEMFLLFEKGLFLGAFRTIGPAENTKNGRIAAGKNGLEMAKYVKEGAYNLRIGKYYSTNTLEVRQDETINDAIARGISEGVITFVTDKKG